MREDHRFQSSGADCAAWLYRGAPVDRAAPCVVMAHGFSAVREQRLPAFAEAFAELGCHVLLFDYRHFGASEGEPRQLLDVRRQLADWRAAIAYARNLPGVDAKRIALFGSSFSGGHVQQLAAEDHGIAAVIAQGPFCDGLRNLPALGVGHALRLSLAGLRDAAGAALGAAPLRLAAVGQPGDRAIMTTPDAAQGFARITPSGSNWRNEVCARVALQVGFYRPGLAAVRIACPILYCIAEYDVLTPADLAYAAAARAPHAEVRSYPCGHFDIYLPPHFDSVVADQRAFLRQHLL